ncbi:MAG: RtcB family protein [Bdellovibrionales bacterium]|nr:RtcB family protein [Bdellovibrionales bacterium]
MCGKNKSSEAKKKSKYEVLETKSGKLVKTWTKGVPFEEEAKNQLRKLAELPFIHKWVAVMPDVHAGRGSTVGSVIPTTGAIIPAAVGVDIGCGMMAQKTSLKASDLPDNLKAIRTQIERDVPVGFGYHKKRVPIACEKAWVSLDAGYNQIMEKHPLIKATKKYKQLGTLGGGNHFIELCLDEEQNVLIMLHSGSRGVGNNIGRYFIELAKKEMERWFIHTPNTELAYLPEGSEHFEDYIEAVGWAQGFARINREVIMAAVIEGLQRSKELPTFLLEESAVNCHHNYVELEHHYGKNVYVTRKGAVRARKGDLGIIPGSMGARTFIVEGLGNEESFHSCSHGAGRTMSRTRAKELITVDEHRQATEGVECKKDQSVIDESPRAYKDIDAVMEAQSDLVKVRHTLKQIVCVKG